MPIFWGSLPGRRHWRNCPEAAHRAGRHRRATITPRRSGRFLTAQPRAAAHGRLAGRKGATLTALLNLEPG